MAFATVLRRTFCSGKVPEKLWKLGRLNHIAIATPDLAASSSLYKNILGAEISEPQDLPEHGVTTVFVNLGNTKLELLHPLGEKSPIQVCCLCHFSGDSVLLISCSFIRDFWIKTNQEDFTIYALKLTT